MRITCSRCGSTLATGLRMAPIDLRRDNGNEEPTLPEGVAAIDPNPVILREALSGTETEQAPANSIVVRPDARVEGSVAVAPGSSQGCCDLDAFLRPNQACATCGQVLGMAWLDCQVPHEVRFRPSAVNLTD